MKPKFKLFRSASFFAGLLMVVFVSSCGSSYENASVQNDGIYASDAIANEKTQKKSENGEFYKNYFEEQDQLISQARSQNEVFTDIDSYSSQGAENAQQEDIILNENEIQHQSYGGWGTQPTSVSINVIDNSFGPRWGWGGFYGPGMGWGGFGPGWGGFYGPGMGWGGFYGSAWGWGGFYGPSLGWGSFYGPGWGYGFGYPYSPYYYGRNRYAGLAYHYNYRNQALAYNNTSGRYSFDSRGRSSADFRTSKTSNRSRANASRSNRSSHVDANGRRIRNSSNVNARVRSNRSSERSITNTTRSRNRYSNRSVQNNNNSRSIRAQRRSTSNNNRSYTPRAQSNTRSTTRSRRSSSSVRSSSGSRGSSSGSSGRSSGGRSSSSRGGRG